jgi:hypothetical protein
MKRKNQILVLIISASLIFIHEGHAQESNSLYPKGLSIGVNSDAFTGMELGYIQPVTILSFPSYYYVRLNVPLLSSIKQKKLDTWEVKVGTTQELYSQNKFILLTDFNLFSIKHSQSLGTFVPLGFNLKVTPAYLTKNGYIGFQTSYNQVLFTYIRHSEYVKESFREIYDVNNQLLDIKPKNGFYAFTGSHLSFGLEGMFRLSDRLKMYYDFGLRDYLSKYTGLFNAMMYGQIPFYADIQFNYKIKQNENR